MQMENRNSVLIVGWNSSSLWETSWSDEEESSQRGSVFALAQGVYIRVSLFNATFGF